MATRIRDRFSVRIRSVGSSRSGRHSLGFTIPQVVCDDLNLKIHDWIKVEIKKESEDNRI